MQLTLVRHGADRIYTGQKQGRQGDQASTTGNCIKKTGAKSDKRQHAY